MTTHNPITAITAEQAAFVLPRLAEYGFKPNEAGEIVTMNESEFDKLQMMIVFEIGRHERMRPQRRVVVVEGFAKQPGATLAQYGYCAEGVAFPVAGDHSLSLVRAAVRDLGGDWRLWALVEDTAEGCAPRFRCIVGRASPWGYPSSVEAADEAEFKAVESGLVKDPVQDALHLAQARQAVGLDYDEVRDAREREMRDGGDFAGTSFAASRRATSIPIKPSAGLSWLLDMVRSVARAEGFDLGTALTQAEGFDLGTALTSFADLPDMAARPSA